YFSVPLVNVSVVEGRPAELPCDITPPGEDTLHMVFWFKDEAGVPLYTKDTVNDTSTPFGDFVIEIIVLQLLTIASDGDGIKVSTSYCQALFKVPS
ncbi:hypothetical protein ALC56_09608, partial [Trachymyrmex septentrionalis]